MGAGVSSTAALPRAVLGQRSPAPAPDVCGENVGLVSIYQLGDQPCVIENLRICFIAIVTIRNNSLPSL